MTLADSMSTRLSDPIKSQPKQDSRQINLVLHMPEVAGLIRHLDLLYAKMLIGQQQETQTIGWYNHGDSRVREG